MGFTRAMAKIVKKNAKLNSKKINKDTDGADTEILTE
jgi:hypothetical protein